MSLPQVGEEKNEEIETILMPIVQNENAGEDRKEDEEEMSIEDHLITTATGMRFQVSGLCLITLLLFPFNLPHFILDFLSFTQLLGRYPFLAPLLSSRLYTCTLSLFTVHSFY